MFGHLMGHYMLMLLDGTYMSMSLDRTSHAEVHMDVCLFVCCFTSQVNSYGHCGTVSSPNHTFSWAGLNKRLTSNSCTYFHL